MKIFKTALILLIVFSASLSMPVCSYTAEPEDAGTCYPLEVGNTWTYQFGDNNGTAKYEVIGYLEEYHAYLITYSAKMIDVSLVTESIIANKGGSILNLGGTDIASGNSRLIYGHSEIILKSPLKVGMTWEYDKDNQGDGVACKVKCKVMKITDCEVKASRFENVCVIRRVTYYIDKNTKKEYREIHYEYYAPRVGKIKEELVEDALEAMREGHAVKKDKPAVLLEIAGYKIK